MDPVAVRKWADVLQQVAKDPKWIAANANYGGIPHVLSPEETAAYLAVSLVITGLGAWYHRRYPVRTA